MTNDVNSEKYFSNSFFIVTVMMLKSLLDLSYPFFVFFLFLVLQIKYNDLWYNVVSLSWGPRAMYTVKPSQWTPI